MDELIKRQNAVDFFAKRRDELIGIYGDLGGAMSGVVKLLNELPPETELEPCDFCKHKDDCGDMALYCPSERRTDE